MEHDCRECGIEFEVDSLECDRVTCPYMARVSEGRQDMSKHYTITVRVNEVTEAETDHRGNQVKARKVEEASDVTIRAETKEMALEKLAIIIAAL